MRVTVRPLRPLLSLLVTGLVALAPYAAQAQAQLPPQAPYIFSGSGPDVVRSSIAAFKSHVGFSRQVTWDDVPDQNAAPHALPSDFYQSQGLNLYTAGPGGGGYLQPPQLGVLEVSATASNATSTPILFGDQHPGFPTVFTTYSASRIFRPYTTNNIALRPSVDVSFVLPGTSTRAGVAGFGAVFTDVNLDGPTTIEFFGLDLGSLGVYTVPAGIGHKSVSFLGVVFPQTPVTLVRITLGTGAVSDTVLEDATHDVVAMDDIFYGEPQPFPTPALSVTTPTTQTDFTATGPFLTLSGRKTNLGGVNWSNDRGGHGDGYGGFGNLWAVQDIPIAEGPNVITVSAINGTGLTNLVLHVNGGPYTYSLAEGSTGSFFDTDISIANPTATAAPVTIQFLPEGGGRVELTDVIGAMRRKVIHVDDVPGLEATAFSTIVTSPDRVPLVVERTMFWDPTYYGGKGAAAVDTPSETWRFAEGVQNSFFNTFILLENPGLEPATVTLIFERAFGEPPQILETRVSPLSRMTIDAASIDGLIGRSFGLSIEADRPIVAERATYFGTSLPYSLWSGGHGSPGVTAPSGSWFFAEGATGPFRQTFLLLSNPSDAAALPVIQYSGNTHSDTLIQPALPAHSRLTIPLEQVTFGTNPPPLADTEFAARVFSEVPIVVERAMYWLGPPGPWADGTSSFGTRTTGVRWGFAEGRVGGPRNFHTYIRIFNAVGGAQQVAEVKLTFFTDEGDTVVRTCTIPPFMFGDAPPAFVTIDANTIPELNGRSFATLIESTNGVDITTERSMYWDANGVFWAAGITTAGTRLP